MRALCRAMLIAFLVAWQCDAFPHFIRTQCSGRWRRCSYSAASCHHIRCHHIVGHRCAKNDADIVVVNRRPSSDWLSIQTGLIMTVAASISVVVVGAPIIGAVEPANAFDGTTTTTIGLLQQQSSKDHVGAIFQSFVHMSPAQVSPRTMLPLVLASEQPPTSPDVAGKAGTRNVVKEQPKAMQQQPKADPIAPAAGKLSPAKEVLVKPTISTKSATTAASSKPSPKKGGQLQTSGLQTIAEENKIEVELICKDSQRPLDSTAPIVKIDRETFRKVKVYQPPFLQYLPSSVQPLVSKQFQSLRVLKEIPNEQLFVASVFAGSLTEIIRTSILYPLSTVKSRVQARKSRSSNRKRPLLRKLRITWLTFAYEAKRGDWYAGLLPSMLITVPASGVYSGAKEVSKRAFSMAIQVQLVQNLFTGDAATSSYYSALVVNLLAAFVADIAALAIRTPADVLSLRLQVFGDNNVRSDFGSWAKDSVALLPAMLLTDLPFLLSRIFLNAAITTSGENLGRYEVETITIGEYRWHVSCGNPYLSFWS